MHTGDDHTPGGDPDDTSKERRRPSVPPTQARDDLMLSAQQVLQQAYETTRPQTLLGALYRTYEHSGFTMAGSVAFSFVLALFPFCIFIAAVAGVFGGHDLAQRAIAQLFEVLPPQKKVIDI